MWDKMVEVADSFYETGELFEEVFRVLFAWAMMLLPILFVFGIGLIFIGLLLDVIKDKLTKNGED